MNEKRDSQEKKRGEPNPNANLTVEKFTFNIDIVTL